MTDEKIIKEIEKVLDECCHKYDKDGKYMGNKCNPHDCEYWCDTNYICCSYNKKESIALYEAGYRKIPKDSVVLTREEYDDIAEFYNIDGCKAYKIRKETAKEIINMLVPPCERCDENWHKGCLCLRATIAEKIAKKYGVEIEE